MPTTLSLAPDPINFANDPIMITVTSGESLDADNLTCSVTIKDALAPVGNGDFIVKLTAPYDGSGKMTCNLSDIFDLIPPLPRPAGSGSGTHYGSYIKYRILHGDRFGTPPVDTSSTTSDEFAVIRGSSPRLRGFGSTPAAWYLMHSYKVIMGSHEPVVKVVSPSQPEPIYFYAPAATSVGWTATVRYLDGTQDVVTGTFSLLIGLTHHHLNLTQISPAAGDVISYDLVIAGSGYTRTIRYIVDRHPNDYERIICYENGCGGMETVRMAGRHSRSQRVSRQVAVGAVWAGYNHADGQYQTTSVNGGEVLQLNTGYVTKSYVQHLEQIMYSDVWLYDRVLDTLERYRVDANSVQVHTDNDQRYQLTISISPSHDSSSSNTWGL